MKTTILALATAALLCSGLSFAGDNSHRRYQSYGFNDHDTRYDDHRRHNRADRHRNTHKYSRDYHNDLALFFLFNHHDRGYRDHHRRSWGHHSGDRRYDRHDRHSFKHHRKHQRKYHH